MPKETFMLVSLKEDKAKKLAQAMSSTTCRKILDFLANKEATETEISEKLNIPISTVHYNLSQLKESKLVETEEFHYSKKGKEVLHYKLANKYIIIAPKENDSHIMDALKNLIPVAIIMGVGTAVWKYFAERVGISGVAENTVLKVAAPAIDTAVEVGQAVPEMARIAYDTSVNNVIPIVQSTPAWKYFVFGAVVGIALYFAVDLIRRSMKD
ncbi:helix-turn-helix transcriptional regulator [Candidatus Woesearchaeota archaeon]|nr:helix-turn-helix transcriptional regulator [Candidatus Woesearchaeota archaeon]